MKKLLFGAVCLIFLLVLALPAALPVAAASPPEPTYGTAVVDGNPSEWNANDFFAEMHRGWDPTKAWESNLSLRYNCTTQTMYVLVLTNDAIPAVTIQNDTIGAWGKIGGFQGAVVYNNNSGNDGNPPDFAWVWGDYTPGGAYAKGYEASFHLAGNATYAFVAHIEVWDGTPPGAQTSGTTPKTGIPLVITCYSPGPIVPELPTVILLGMGLIGLGGLWFALKKRAKVLPQA